MTTLKFFSPTDIIKRFPPGKFQNYRDMILEINWDESFIKKIENFREGKKEKRIEKYLTKKELARFIRRVREKRDTVIRFGGEKEKPRGEFCLVGATYKPGGKLYVLYRSLELTFEIFFDLWMFGWICSKAKVPLNKVIIISPRVFMSSRAGRLNYASKLEGLLLK